MLGFFFRGSRVSEFRSARVEKALLVYCSSIFLDRTRAGVRALSVKMQSRAETWENSNTPNESRPSCRGQLPGDPSRSSA